MERSRSDYYRVLQVDPAASPLVIQAAYRVLAQIFHPDVSGDDAEMKRLNAAWEVLGDPRRRKQYDIERAGRHASHSGTTRHATTSPGPEAPRTYAPGGITTTATPTTRTHTTARPDGHAGSPVGPASGSTIRFGRYEGWTVGQVARADPPFLEWLRRVPLGRALKPEIDIALQRADGARRMGIAGSGAAGSGAAGPDASNDQPVHTWAPGAPTRVR